MQSYTNRQDFHNYRQHEGIRENAEYLGWTGSPGGSDSKESTCNARDLGSIPGLGRSPGGGHGNPFQYSCLENSLDRRVWRAKVHSVALSFWTFLLAQPVKNESTCREGGPGKIRWRRDSLPTPGFLGFPGGSAGRESIHSTADLGLIPWVGRSPGGGYGNPL